ncbi:MULTISPECIES: Gfo/Idh/MocA family protein [unclassified Curtobacterium]|jgi:predicted dehydrogenase|uniref:Gfo/Idh/MocA family protein n=1 Tax=unclassified Curtobacterium TaxID=257496 RepID=UPI00052A8AF1|nr:MULTISPECIES: Gfo/Idh/MocA family oxidoreductase [unclassified Curtobacterium]AIV40711.1 oxidoreductase [Curtobacterium sp. MR_MD2014]MCM3504161.1 Gfo/Idh/MocA family oxidoreductase [Curtobacterium sp. ODYSSEY 48 V2]MCM3521803.1 Gfo/Idh/MocA family oxidoreductase [Curtobacterium sp. P97]MDB6427995.1 Gfo/Idh/MocA family oxidoreductase [Curtobacterium sp. 20TX0008]MDT0210941.1 Gfo/Idh/MocA family oxidoreductase [Curtobacterium sp. BRD11]
MSSGYGGRRIRVAVVGTGMIAGVHARAARAAGAEVVGVLGRTPARSEQVAAQLDVPRGYASLDEVIADAPDVVHVCTPNDQHHPQSLAVVRAGINVVCEKPLAISAEQAAELVAAADEAGVVATVPFVYRYHPVVREIRARIAAGELGRLLAVHGHYLQDWMLDEDASSWRVDAGAGGVSRAFADIGSHWCDLVEFVTGDPFAAVSAATDIVYPTRPAASGPSFSGSPDPDPVADAGQRAEVTTEDTAVATFRTGTGRIGNVVVSQVAAGRKNRLWFEVDGTLGSAAFDQEQPEAAWFGNERGAQIVVRDPSLGFPDQRRLAVVPAGHPQGYLDAFAAFVADTYAAVRAEGDRSAWPEGLPTFADGARAASVIEAVVASAADGTWRPVA